MPHYTLVQYVPSVATNHATRRDLLITPNQRVADHLYRGIQMHQEPLNTNRFYMSNVNRPDVQIWTYTSSRADGFEIMLGTIYNGTFPNSEIQRVVRGSAMQQWVVDRTGVGRGAANTGMGTAGFPMIEQQFLTDPINMRSFFIRNKNRKDEFWTLDKDTKTITASTTQRSKFRIQINGNTNGNLVMIDSDPVNISVFDDELQRRDVRAGSFSTLRYLTTDPAQGNVFQFRFSALYDGGFAVNYDQAKGTTWVMHMGDSHQGGDEWELC